MGNRIRKPLIFIVYQDFEHELAYNLQILLKTWGYEAFQCRQGDRDGEAFRKELRQNIRRSDLVLILLSREFRWSPYCQAEAGTAMALEKPYIPITIPPADSYEVGKEIAPVLEGCQFLCATDPDFISLLQSRIVKTLAKSKESLRELISKLQNLEDIDLSALAIHDVREEANSRASVHSAIQNIGDKYRRLQPKKTISSTWRTLADPACKISIIGNVTKLLKGDSKTVDLTFVGVSLKFSLFLISDALELAAKSKETSLPKKTLNISLVHMHDQSYVLHALGDEKDISAIRKNFVKEWPTTWSKWKSLCGEIIELPDPRFYRIDYIPPRVGILMEAENQSFLYAGRCAFKQTDPRLPIFNLDVGENEYLFYAKDARTKSDDPNCAAIEEFKAAFNAYKEIQNNSGVTPIWESSPWINRLWRCIDELEEPADVTFISGTATKFEPLIIKALEKGATVRTYVCDSGTSSKHARDLFNRLKSQRGELARKVEQHRYQHPATFRGVVIKDNVIGLQMYVNAGSGKALATRPELIGRKTVSKIPLCLIITPCFQYFQELQRQMLTFAKGDSSVEEIISFE